MWSMIITKETDYALRILRVLLDGDQFRFRHLGHRMLLPVQQHPQNAQRVVRLFGDDLTPYPLFGFYNCKEHGFSLNGKRS